MSTHCISIQLKILKEMTRAILNDFIAQNNLEIKNGELLTVL